MTMTWTIQQPGDSSIVVEHRLTNGDGGNRHGDEVEAGDQACGEQLVGVRS